MKTSIFVLTFCLLISNIIIAQNKLKLQFGKYNVGYTRYYIEDSTTKYPIEINGEDTTWSHKPIAIAVWFPTNDTNSKLYNYRDYTEFSNYPNHWSKFIKRLKEFNVNWIEECSLGSPKNFEDSISNKKWMKELFHEKVSANFKARFIQNKKFPLIVYQQCLGGTLEENAILFEFLASHGYIIVCGSNQNNKGKTLHPDWNLKRSKKDMECLLKFALKELPIIPEQKHLLGFSFGGQSNLSLLGHGYGPFKSATFFDSQLEYAKNIYDERFTTIMPNVLENLSRINLPTMFIAGHEAAFGITDTLEYSDRICVTLNSISHYSFTSQYNVIKGLQKKDNFENEILLYSNVADLYLEFVNKIENGIPINKNYIRVDKVGVKINYLPHKR